MTNIDNLSDDEIRKAMILDLNAGKSGRSFLKTFIIYLAFVIIFLAIVILIYKCLVLSGAF